MSVVLSGLVQVWCTSRWTLCLGENVEVCVKLGTVMCEGTGFGGCENGGAGHWRICECALSRDS